MTTREDVLLWRLMDAHERGDLEALMAYAVALGEACPDLRTWTAYVVAGCRSVAGDPARGLRVLAEADARGGWWAPALLDDPALTAVWALDRDGIRSRSLRRWNEARTRVSWEVVPASTTPAAVIVALHANLATSEALTRSLWGELPSCALVVARSSQLQADGVRDWRDRDRAIADVHEVAAAARAEFGESTPLIVAGLGAGGRIAIDAALTTGLRPAGAIAFAPSLGGLPTGGAPAWPAGCWIFPGGQEPALASCTRFATWARTHGVTCTVRPEPGMGHHYPLRFGESVAPAIESILAAERTAGR